MRKPGFIAALPCCAFLMMLAIPSGRAGARGAECPDLTPIRVPSLKIDVIKITPAGRRALADSDDPGLPPDGIIVTAQLRGPKRTSRPEGRARVYVLHAAQGTPGHRHVFQGLAIDGKGVAMPKTFIREIHPQAAVRALPLRGVHHNCALDMTTNIAC